MGAFSHFDPEYFMVDAYFYSEQKPFLCNKIYLGFYFLSQVRLLDKAIWRTGFRYPWWGFSRRRTGGRAFGIPGGGYWRRQTGELAFGIPGEVLGQGDLEHWLSVSLVGDIGEGGLEDGLLVSLVGDICEGGQGHWLAVSLVGDIGEGGQEHWLSVSLMRDIGEGGLEDDVSHLPHGEEVEAFHDNSSRLVRTTLIS
ncbi:hypothetical protein PoB_004839000 [Plakobranchus ocellatus]|uniref:Uncharacterized protein n=1 Tax=Plakobranchus ocellatus TaxID=259542 RepID=A0AAV4BS15_9GAST|nr:hypothetical protein PoB_004839000 [Plakobranchus ocellatus]